MIQKKPCVQSKCKYPVTCDYNNSCMEKLMIETKKTRKVKDYIAILLTILIGALIAIFTLFYQF